MGVPAALHHQLGEGVAVSRITAPFVEWWRYLCCGGMFTCPSVTEEAYVLSGHLLGVRVPAAPMEATRLGQPHQARPHGKQWCMVRKALSAELAPGLWPE